MPQSKKPQQSIQQTPAQRLSSLSLQLKSVELLHQLVEHEAGQELINVAKAEVRRRNIARNAINWDSPADAFIAHEKFSLYASGYIQGVEFLVNVLTALPQQKANLEKEIAEVEAELKGTKKRVRQSE